MADENQVTETPTTQEETPAPSQPEPEVTPAPEVAKETEAGTSGEAVEDTYESVSPPEDATNKAEPEKTNGTAAAEGIEVPLDENEAAAQPLTGEAGTSKDVEAGDQPKNPASLAAGARILGALRKKEVLFPLIGGITFLIGLILIISGLMVMQGKCDRATAGVSDDAMQYGADSHMTSHDHDHNSTVDESLLENIAEGRPAFQSSTFMDKGISLNASLATDGKVGSSMSKGECAQTERQEHPSWHVDLGAEKPVHRIKIYIPSNCCVGELHDFVVRVGNSDDLTENAQCKHFMGTALRPALSMQCDQMLTGRYVSVHMLGDDGRTRDRLSICEVMVYSH